MNKTRSADVAVVGSGIVGLACALELAQAGYSVVLVGPRTGEHAGQASRAAGAMLTVFSEVEAAHPPQRVAVEVAERVAARAGYDAWLDQLSATAGCPAPGLTPGVWVTASVPADRAELAAIAAAAAAGRLPGHLHAPEDVPGLHSESVFEALWLPGEAGIDAAELTTVATAAALAHPRITWHDTDTARIVDTETMLRLDLVDGEPVTAEHLVLAAGVQTTALARRSPSLRLDAPPVLAGRGVSVVLDAVPDPVTAPIRTPNRGFACGAHLVPRVDGRTYLGATNRLSTRPEPGRRATVDEIATLLHDGVGELNTGLRHAQVTDVRVGYRPYTIDHLPLVGRTANPKILLATATYRCGILLAPRVATLIRNELDHPGTLDAHPYSPRRTIVAPDLAQLIDARGGDLAELMCQPGGHLPGGAAGRIAAAIRAALAHGLNDPAVRRLVTSTPVEEVLPLVLDIAARSTR
ncbi:NAD(P)/FAD-dependent oxidoreductase [Amycolatopsis vastitatis]|uniref:FAD-dependent oxidoreductase n=1 Tax=Amycolatopsis vastitatis TaxID=1905142 RepID=A0A229SQ95_9PSEU|nr:FAD-binding oxidoreductase [Amycolatopsis vastitatis]OXM60954.1 FAD-dependent oxidoreductase [Amycolatopsis vastitatis]